MGKATTTPGEPSAANGGIDLTKIKLDKESRRNKGTVRLICLLDVILTLFLFGFYFIGGLILNTVVFQVKSGPLPKYGPVIISLILWAAVFTITYLQLAAAYRLFLVTFQQDALGPQVAVARSHSWLRTAALAFGLIVFKLIYFCFREPPPFAIVWFMALFEILFRLLGMYFVREFCDDLKHQIGLVVRRPNNTATVHSKSYNKGPVDITEIPTVVVSKISEV